MIRWQRSLGLSIGLLLTVALLGLSAPLWLPHAWQQPAVPALARPIAGPCLLPSTAMRAQHMRLLTGWRDLRVRDTIRTWTAPDGTAHAISLRGSCLGCHPNREQFCDACHASFGVQPDCWACHTPEGM